ncbi:hypothetical protein BG004_005756 [Podila humilis]|nr:hypothetical protein BG004_005756 [Podila humilis]
MLLCGSLLAMVLFYYVSLPEPSMFPSGGGPGAKGSQKGAVISDDTEIVMEDTAAPRLIIVGSDVHGSHKSHESWIEANNRKVYRKPSKTNLRDQRNYNIKDTSNDNASCGLISGQGSGESCTPVGQPAPKKQSQNAEDKKVTEQQERLSIAIGDDDDDNDGRRGSGGRKSSNATADRGFEATREAEEDEGDDGAATDSKLVWTKYKAAAEEESVQEEYDDKGTEREDGYSLDGFGFESESERVEREEKVAIEMEISRDKAEGQDMKEAVEAATMGLLNKDTQTGEEGDEDENHDNGGDEPKEEDLLKFAETEFLDDQDQDESTSAVDDGYRKEDRLGQAGPLETLDDEGAEETD